MASISDKIHKIAKALKVTFTLNGKPANLAEVFSKKGLLPAFARRADQLASLCMGYGIGVKFNETTEGLLGVEVEFDEIIPNSVRYLCILDVLCELIYNSPSKQLVPLDELMYD